MSHTRLLLSTFAALLIAATAGAQTPASAPAGSTGLCRDGSYWSNATKRGACHGHKGVQEWYGAAGATDADQAAAATPAPAPMSTPAASAPVAAAAPAAPAATAAPSPSAAPAPAAATNPKAMNPASITAAAGGGNGQVWVNSSSKVYHCPSDRWYGKTKSGAYMTEADAIAKGNHADHGKACTA